MTKAERLYNETFVRIIQGWGVILSFRVVVDAGLPSAVRELARGNRKFVDEEIQRRPGGRSIFLEGADLPPDFGVTLARAMTEATVASANASVDGASIIFMHTILDGVALDCCRIAAMLAPERWSELVKDRRVGLDELKGATYEQLLRKLLDDYLERLERESLLRKIDLIYRACDPPSGTPTATSYMFDRTRIERLDRIRHDIVHGEGIGRSIDNAFDELTYMVRTCSHLLVLLHDRFGLMLNPAYVRDFYARRAQTE